MAAGDLIVGPNYPRFFTKVRKTRGCWYWTGAVAKSGYGAFRHNGKTCLAHRVSFEIHGRRLVAGKEVDHKCRNKLCVRPDHLEQVTKRVNRERQGAAVKKCPRGHRYTKANTYVYRNTRACITCRRDRDSRRVRNGSR